MEPAAVAAPEVAAELDSLLERYAAHLRGQRGLSENTARIYQDDLAAFQRYLAESGAALGDMNRRMARSYLAWLATEGRETVHPYSGRKQREGYARVSILRKLTALRSFYRFLAQEGWFKHNPVPSGRSLQVKTEKPLPSTSIRRWSKLRSGKSIPAISASRTPQEYSTSRIARSRRP